jgi:hypothetical protein
MLFVCAQGIFPYEALQDYRLFASAKAAILSGDLSRIQGNIGELTDEPLLFIYNRLEREAWQVPVMVHSLTDGCRLMIVHQIQPCGTSNPLPMTSWVSLMIRNALGSIAVTRSFSFASSNSETTL